MSNIDIFVKYITSQQNNSKFSTLSPIKEFQEFGPKKYVVLPPGSFDDSGTILPTDLTTAHGLLPGSKISTGTGSAPINDGHTWTLIHRHGFPKRPQLGQHNDMHKVIEQGNKPERLHDFADKLNQ